MRAGGSDASSFDNTLLQPSHCNRRLHGITAGKARIAICVHLSPFIRKVNKKLSNSRHLPPNYFHLPHGKAEKCAARELSFAFSLTKGKKNGVVLMPFPLFTVTLEAKILPNE